MLLSASDGAGQHGLWADGIKSLIFGLGASAPRGRLVPEQGDAWLVISKGHKARFPSTLLPFNPLTSLGSRYSLGLSFGGIPLSPFCSLVSIQLLCSRVLGRLLNRLCLGVLVGLGLRLGFRNWGNRCGL
jgi:hypothetical protein